jgi:hypothetical protein
MLFPNYPEHFKISDIFHEAFRVPSSAHSTGPVEFLPLHTGLRPISLPLISFEAVSLNILHNEWALIDELESVGFTVHPLGTPLGH